MSNYCKVCGRELTKTAGPIGPKCLQKIRPRNRRSGRISKAQQQKMYEKYDIYGEIDGSGKTGETSKSVERKKTRKGGKTV